MDFLLVQFHFTTSQNFFNAIDSEKQILIFSSSEK